MRDFISFVLKITFIRICRIYHPNLSLLKSLALKQYSHSVFHHAVQAKTKFQVSNVSITLLKMRHK